MSVRNKMFADSLFAVQVIGGCVLCGSQFVRFLDTTDGYSLAMLLLMEVYLLLHLALALGSHRAAPSRVTYQTLLTFVIWIVLIGSNIGALWWNGKYRWSANDTWTSILAFGGAVVVFSATKLTNLSWRDPLPKSVLAVLFKALPQSMMTYKVLQIGGAGVPALAIIAGNITILIRIGQTVMAIREAGWERNRTWLLVSETLNWLSWTAVGVAWFCWWIR